MQADEKIVSRIDELEEYVLIRLSHLGRLAQRVEPCPMFNMTEASKRDWPSSGIPKVGFSRETNVERIPTPRRKMYRGLVSKRGSPFHPGKVFALPGEHRGTGSAAPG